MHKITTHQVGIVNEALVVNRLYQADGVAKAPVAYEIYADESKPLPSLPGVTVHTTLKFHHGDPKEVGVRGLTNESVLAVLIDRMVCFQTSDMRCRENAIALTHLEEAMMWLQKRTRQRIASGIEGTQEK
jgi:hypothetical protein